MPSAAAPRGLLLRGNQAPEFLGFREAECPTTLAVSPSRKLLALATAAAGGDNCGCASSRIDLIRLWREEGEQDLGRPLKAVASIPDFGRVVHRLAWSRGVATSRYPLGLIAGGLDGGEVHIWDPSLLTYMEETQHTTILGDESTFHFPTSLRRALLPNSLSAVEERPEMEFKDKRIKEAAADMISKMNSLILEHGFKERPSKDSEDDWDIIQQEEIPPEDFEDCEFCEGIENGLILKLNHLNGPVLGLAFNCKYTNMLACAAYGEKLRVYFLDYTDEFASRGNDKLKTQITFLEWNEFYPSVLASASDMGDIKIWDLRERSSKCTYKFDSTRSLSCSEVHWNPCDPVMFAVASKENCECSIKIWDARYGNKPQYKFGNAKGVSSFSWSTSGLIIATDVDGVINCWRREGKEGHSSWALAGGFCEARWCQCDTPGSCFRDIAAVSSNELEVYRTPADECIWPNRDMVMG